MFTMIRLSLLCLLALPMTIRADEHWVVYEGSEGPGKGKHIVLVSGDEEYRSEEALPQLGKILAKQHGFKCTVLFAIDPADGTINPNINNNIPGLESLKTADLMIIATRFRNLPDDQMKHVVDYIESGKPIIGMRTATHAFNLKKESSFAKFTWNNGDKAYPGGFGKQILGETWISHHGSHGSQSTRGLLAKGMESHPILKGIKDGDVWGPTDVYGVKLPLASEFKPLVMGQVLVGMKADDKPYLEKGKNDPMMPVAWIREGGEKDKRRVFTTTMGSSTDLESEGVRRMLVNAAYWCVGLEAKIAEKSSADLVGEFKPLPFKFNGHKKGVKPSDHVLK
ncbi:MAG: ThuA domain-containing protein [Planctomycetes bacterium]|nr:ThuA domain-containing protein [Planctomycetota bacterium]